MKIQPYTKKELALAYAPELTPHSALNRLAIWINNNPELKAALINSGYTTRQKIFTSYQVRLIFEFLGEP